MVQEAVRLATNTKSRQDRRKNKLAEKIETIIHEENLLKDKVLVLAFDDFEKEYKAMSGLVAGQIAEIYQRPVILTFKNDEDGNYYGSLRVHATNNPIYENFKDQCNESGLCTFVAGHQSAAGIGIFSDKVQDLIDYFNNKYQQADTEIYHNVDFIIDAENSDLPQLIYDLSKMEDVWGTGIEEPKIAVTNVKIAKKDLALVGRNKNVLWITLPTMKFINFKSSQDEYQSLIPPYDGEEYYYKATIIGKNPVINEFNGKVTPQMEIVDYEINGIAYDF